MFSRLRIASQLVIGFGAILLLLLGISVLANFGSQRSRDTLDAVAKMKGDEVLEQRVERRIYEARMHFWIAVNSKDPDDWIKATHDFTVAAEWVGDLLKSTTETDRAAKVKNLVDFGHALSQDRRTTLAQKQKDNAESQDEMTVAEINEVDQAYPRSAHDRSRHDKTGGGTLNRLPRRLGEDGRGRPASGIFLQTVITGAGIAGVFIGLLFALLFTAASVGRSSN